MESTPNFLIHQEKRSLGLAFVVSVTAHILVVFLILFFTHSEPEHNRDTIFSKPPPLNIRQIVWLDNSGLGGGGGGGGNKMPDPPRKAEKKGDDKITVPVAKPSGTDEQKEEVEPEPAEQQLNIPAEPLADSDKSLPGITEVPESSSSSSQGSGNGGGAGTGSGSGIGSGAGSGLGPGSGGSMGGGVYKPGPDITLPRVIKKIKPEYTFEAMRNRVQGIVILECVVQPDGSIVNIKVTKPLDPGLDWEAIKAVRQWRFVPGSMRGKPVPVLVTIEVTFTLV